MTSKATFLSIPLCLFLTATLVLAGCGGKSQDPQETLAAATRAASEAGSAHAQLNVVISPLDEGPGMALNIMGDAWLDMNRDMLEARFTVMGLELSLRYVDDTAYLNLGGDWYVLTSDIVAGVGEGAIAAIVRVLASVPEILSSNIGVKELGTEKVGDYECTRMEVMPDLQAISSLENVAELAGELDMDADELMAFLEDADIVIEVCIQNDEPVIREVYVAATSELPSVGDIMGIALLPEMARVEITMDFPEYGMEVDVQAPEDAQPFEGL
ncbi:MAG: hypothetical protein JW854_00195 [Actinobacteria bacterium]|nr:hypothetical protein [Actinomycetota bacterium]